MFWNKQKTESDIESRILRMTLREFGVPVKPTTDDDDVQRLYGKTIELYGAARVMEVKNKMSKIVHRN